MDKSRQTIVMFWITHIGLIFFLYPADIIDSLSVGHWCAVLLGFSIHIALVAVYTKGLSYCAPQNVIDLFQSVGRVFAFAMLLPLTLYLFLLMIITVRAYAEIVTVVFLGNTPLWTIMLLFLAVSAFICLLGIESLFRTGMLVMLLFFPFLILVVVLSFQNADWHYMLPLMDRDTATFAYVLRRPFLKSMFAFIGGFLFLGFIPSRISFQGRKIVLSSLGLIPFFLVSVYVPLLTFGENTASKFPFPYIAAVDTVDVSWLMFDRVTMFFMISMLCFVILFLSLAMWMALLLLKRGIPALNDPSASLLLIAIVYSVCLLVPNWSAVERLMWWNTFPRYYAAFVIPLVVYALGMRHRRKEPVRA
ncbi:GerAB/ArcD/ProY family transporter [Cohnella rhizosphaerae]|uniref:Spore germination protein n=1 Tax=Cohnella rhizosphaerae TaxID=1457232 RepID=A0A9X4QWC0_9BACL|nr:GerAB/ArcD/ProY family transporter [Cohnella rhizosphaerae]MDG0813509.1 spore germination protein [Cohnella rhizosphaerae]